MTREEIEELKGLAASMGLYDDKNPCKRAMILGKAIKALEQEPCEDAISRDMALEKMADYVASGYADSVEDFEEYSRIICQLPSVKQEPKTGHWIPVGKELPNVEQYALITVHNQTKMCWYQNGVFVDGEQNAYTKESKELVAWMPLPIPYEPQESEDKE